MNTRDVKMTIIENFIDYLSPENKEEMVALAKDYVDQDHVDEISQSMGHYEDTYLIFEGIDIQSVKPVTGII